MSALAQTFTATSASALASRKSSSFNARSSLMTSSTSSSSSSRGARLQTFARVDGGVGVFGNKAGMTQIFTDDGLCVPVTVIAVKDGNYVSAVRISMVWNFISFPRAEMLAMAVAVWIFEIAFVAVACARKIENDRAKNPFVRDDTASLRMSTLLCARVFATSFSAAVFERANFLLPQNRTALPETLFLFFSFVFVVDDWGPLKKFFFLNKSWLILILSHSNNTG